MRSDPRIGYWVSLAIAGLSGLWLLSLYGFSDELYERLGSNMHAITFLAIFLLLTGWLVSRLFASFVRIRSELHGGRGVLGRWHVDRATWHKFAGPAETMERKDKLALLGLLYFFIALVCGGLALSVPRDAHIFGYIALGMAVLVTGAFLLGTHIYASQLQYRTGEIIVGRRGVSVDGVLHAWDNWLSWPEGAEVIERPVPMLVVGYGYWTRYGPQHVSVRMPVMAGDLAMAREVKAKVNALATGGAKRGRGVPPEHETTDAESET
jgi:hypothetical protein